MQKYEFLMILTEWPSVCARGFVVIILLLCCSFHWTLNHCSIYSEVSRLEI